MKIEHYISQLLYRYQCVTIPGFGAFLTEIQSAKLDESTNSFYPPKKLISFNPYIKNNDGLLANHLAKEEKINYEVAVSVIQTEVQSWRKAIHEYGELSFKNIGGFSLNSEKNLVFVPSEHINYLKESFGLGSFVSPSVKREESKREEYKIVVAELEEKVPIAFTPEKRKDYSFLKYAAIVLVSIGVAGGIGYQLNENYEKNIAQETLLVEQNVQKKVNQKIQEATFFIENPLPSVTLSIPSEKMPYHVVAGAFSIESNADNLLERLNKLGYHAKKITVNKYGLHPVLYGSYSSYSEAYKAMKQIQQVDNPKAWLLIQEF
ncbi:HU domain-containing protein [Flavobacterium sp.]